MNGFSQRLKERKLVQSAIAYLAASFALRQGIDIVAQQFNWPAAVRRGITLALVVGFLLVLWRALLHLSLGERDEATHWLEQSVADRTGSDIVFIKVFHFLDPLLDDPRFEAVVQKVIGPENG